ncbi:hypothetical protein [Bacillus swezeyi]|uniref:hypothetical protein n=1 Tax=Bacillus swezeyi TaxID=1925020 RepID=UPI00123B83AD|nr:hypothetical protein [Bacillus swezeyi]KAA6482023.1 hypothetical protein DX928_02585 [Bacillus swezeyi]
MPQIELMHKKEERRNSSSFIWMECRMSSWKIYFLANPFLGKGNPKDHRNDFFFITEWKLFREITKVNICSDIYL